MNDNPKFTLGRRVVTRGVMLLLREGRLNEVVLDTLFKRHVSEDWGDLDSEDKAANDTNIEEGGRLLSNYALDGGLRIWIITEPDRSVTTALLPDEN